MLSGEASVVAGVTPATRPARYLLDVILDAIIALGVAGFVTMVVVGATNPGVSAASQTKPAHVEHLVLIPKATP